VLSSNPVVRRSSSRAHRARDPQRPENLAATMYHCLGIDPSAVWHDELNRPHPIYHGEPIRDLLS
ncbi:MAG: hypothetical protein ACK5HA_09235, partial [Planctomycetaceae bacterium]